MEVFWLQDISLYEKVPELENHFTVKFMEFYDKKYNLVTLSNSFLKYYGVPTFHDSIKELDELLEKNKYKKITVILFDGLGSYIQENHLKDTDIIRKKKFLEITSVFPPTTVAATTAFLSGKYPIETGWLGWSQYFKQIDRTIDMFIGRDSFTGEILKGNPSSIYTPYENILSIISKFFFMLCLFILTPSIVLTRPLSICLHNALSIAI